MWKKKKKKRIIIYGIDRRALTCVTEISDPNKRKKKRGSHYLIFTGFAF